MQRFCGVMGIHTFSRAQNTSGTTSTEKLWMMDILEKYALFGKESLTMSMQCSGKIHQPPW